MSDLREQLEQIKSEYESIRYPGDLLADLSPRRAMRISGWKVASVIGAAVAASVIVAAIFGPQMWKYKYERELAEKTGNIAPVTKTVDAPALAGVQPASGTSDSDQSLVPMIPSGFTLSVENGAGSGYSSESTSPSFGDISAPSIPSAPSFDLSQSSTQDTSSKDKEQT